MIANSKSEANYHAATTKAFGFLFKYRRLAGDTIETNYNLGRAFHHLGIFHMAIPMYEKAISLSLQEKDRRMREEQMKSKEEKSEEERKESEESEEVEQSLEREAAFNLALIYKNSGNLDLARRYLRDHVTI